LSALRDRFTDSLYGLGWAGVKKLPEPAAAALGREIADTAWRRRSKGVRRLEANLARVVPDASSAQLRRLSRVGMRSYLRYWMESFRLPTYSEQHILDCVHVEGAQRLTDGLASGRGVVLALPHMGNWDLAGAWAVIATRTSFTTVAERLKPESLYDRFVAYRESLGMEVLAHGGSSAFGTLARRLRAGGFVCLVADRDLSASGIGVTFFGETARMPAGPALLAQQTGALLMPVTLWYDSPPRMRARVHEPVEVPESGGRRERTAAMTQSLADTFAAGIAEHPQDWHMLQRFWPADLGPGPQAELRKAAATGRTGRTDTTTTGPGTSARPGTTADSDRREQG
jgi:KDO2-lipid IV(A) lauroyltransferase